MILPLSQSLTRLRFRHRLPPEIRHAKLILYRLYDCFDQREVLSDRKALVAWHVIHRFEVKKSVNQARHEVKQ